MSGNRTERAHRGERNRNVILEAELVGGDQQGSARPIFSISKRSTGKEHGSVPVPKRSSAFSAVRSTFSPARRKGNLPRRPIESLLIDMAIIPMFPYAPRTPETAHAVQHSTPRTHAPQGGSAYGTMTSCHVRIAFPPLRLHACRSICRCRGRRVPLRVHLTTPAP